MLRRSKNDAGKGLPSFLLGMVPSSLLSESEASRDNRRIAVNTNARRGQPHKEVSSLSDNSKSVISSPIGIRFFKSDFREFIDQQVFYLRWNRDDRNKNLSSAFRRLVAALFDGDESIANLCREEVSRSCFPWVICARNIVRLAIGEASFCREALGQTKLDDRFISRIMGMSLRETPRFMESIGKRLARSKVVAKAYSAFREFRAKEIAYYSMPIRNCAVCATMGAGKSTFINALLGSDVLPARCEATTAKITSVYDRDGETRIRGFVQSKRGFEGDCADVSLEQLNAWNDDKDVSRVFLQGDFDGISNNGMVVAIHDTPGANNSLDPSHHKTTIGFLAKNRMDLLVFILNAEQPRTTDEFALLDEILKKVVRPHGTRVLFVLNKADSIDPEKESVQKAIADYRDFLSSLGFKEPIILPAASKVARLVKMSVAKGATENKSHGLSGDEEDFLFPKKRRFIQDPLKHFTDYARFLSPATGLALKARVEKAKTENNEEELALLYSGVPSVEMAISEHLNAFYSAFTFPTIENIHHA